MTPLRAIGLRAVSSKKQVVGISLDEQDRQIRARCDREGWQLVEMVTLPGVKRSDPDIVGIFNNNDPKYAPYRRARQLILSGKYDVFIYYDDGRAGRSKSMYVYLVENAINNGMIAVSLLSGTISEENEDLGIMAGAMNATSNMKRFRKMTAAAMRERVDKGLHQHAIPPTHRVIRDARGKGISLEVREDRRRFFDDAVTLLLQGVGWLTMAVDLAAKFGHVNPHTLNPWSGSYLFRLFHNPYTWGAAAAGYLDKYGIWAFDDGTPVPDGISINRSPNPPVPPLWTGEQAEAIKAELRRRASSIHGRASPSRTYKFTGLLVCDECGRPLSVTHGHHRRDGSFVVYWACTNMLLYRRAPRFCSQTLRIRDDTAQQAISDYFTRMQELGITDIARLVKRPEDDKTASRIAALEKDIATLEEQIENMLILQSKTNVQRQAINLINKAGEQLESLENELRAERAKSAAQSDAGDREQAFRSIMESGPVAFWQSETRQINQTLHRIMGKLRFVVREGQIVDMR